MTTGNTTTTRVARDDARQAFRRFAIQAAILAWAAVIAFWVLYAADHFMGNPAGGAGGALGPFQTYFNFDANGALNSASALAGVNVSVFAIVFTVVSIIVQLSADRYTGVARMFMFDRANILVSAYYVVVCCASVWFSFAVRTEYVPDLTLAVLLSLTTGGLVIILPYFNYVFWFLAPQNIVQRIRRDAVDGVVGGAIKHHDASVRNQVQAATLFALEELTDITNNSISGKDKIIASAAVDALKDLALEYLKVKPQANDDWFTIGPQIALNPDFVAMDNESLNDLSVRRTWVEWKIMRQYLSIYNEALGQMRDINYVIAIDTRYIGEAAAKANDIELIELVFRYLNSYVRATLNARDVRTTYNVLNQYRMLIEDMLQHGQHKAARDGVKHMKYYGLVAFEAGLSFVTETVAYDLSSLAQLANELNSPAEKAILDEFLELDRPPFVRGEEKALMGVRKAQVKLAAYYLLTDQAERARAIANDMKGEPRERMLIIRRQLQLVENKDFWEIIDRGRNFEYMPPQQRACLTQFFEWLDIPPEKED